MEGSFKITYLSCEPSLEQIASLIFLVLRSIDNMSSGAMEVDKTEEEGQAFFVKPMVLPNISIALKTAWKANSVKLGKTRIFHFLCWVHTTTRVTYVDRVI